MDDLSPCVTFNKVNTYAWFRENIRRLYEEGYEPTDRGRALDILMGSEKVPTGIFYQDSDPPRPYEKLVLRDVEQPPAFADLAPDRWDYAAVMDEFR